MTSASAVYHVVVLEDEPALRGDLVEYLSKQGFSVSAAATLKEYRQVVTVRKPDLVLLDINLPDGNGLDIARELRAFGDTRIVMLTNLGTLDDRVTGLDSGADAYLVKHADLREIEATIRTVLRRTSERPTEAVWNYNRTSWQLTSPNGTSVKLTASEAVFMSKLIEAPGIHQTRNEIAAALPRPIDSNDRSLDSMVKRLRKKIEAESGTPFPINVVYGVGYSFTAQITFT